MSAAAGARPDAPPGIDSNVMSIIARVLCLALVAATAGCSSKPAPAPQAPVASAGQPTPLGQLPTVSLEQLLEHTKKLSSDEFEGRAPGTKGEDLTVQYLV